MISLKQLLILMGTISLLMTIAVVMVKIKHPSHVTFGEVRAIDRLCQRQADHMMTRIASEATKDEVTFLKKLHSCMGACRNYLIQSRGKGVTIGGLTPMTVPECFGNKIKREVEQGVDLVKERAVKERAVKEREVKEREVKGANQ